MSLDVSIYKDGVTRKRVFFRARPYNVDTVNTLYAYSDNITHNAWKMADACGLYMPIWRPERFTGKEPVRTDELVGAIEKGLLALKSSPEIFRGMSLEKGGYDRFVKFTERYLDALKKNPGAFVSARG